MPVCMYSSKKQQNIFPDLQPWLIPTYILIGHLAYFGWNLEKSLPSPLRYNLESGMEKHFQPCFGGGGGGGGVQSEWRCDLFDFHFNYRPILSSFEIGNRTVECP